MGDLVQRLRHCVATASNDDLSDPMTEKRERHVARITTMMEAADLIESFEAALRECAADWSSAPGTVSSAYQEVAAEFQRRMEIAGTALGD